MENTNGWCHESCYFKATFYQVDPIFEGICHEDCDDENCTLEHEDFSG